MEEKLETIVKYLKEQGRFSIEEQILQHGQTTVFEHSVYVAKMSLSIANYFQIKVNKEDLIMGALLHDYFLYDWHEADDSHRLHGFTHGNTALKNAKEDFELTPKMEMIIKRHMFPLTPMPPTCKEAWIVCMADKYCATKETVSGLRERFSLRGLFM